MNVKHSANRLLSVCLWCGAFLAISASVLHGADVTSIWTTGAGDWADGANWSSTNYPDNGNGGAGTFDAELNTTGVITLDQDITIGGFTLSTGTLTAVDLFTLTLNEVFTWMSGTVGGVVSIEANGGIELSGGNAKRLGTGLNTGATLINNGTANLSGGDLQIADSGGAATGSLLINNGTFNATDDADITRVSAPVPTASITNAGTGIFNKSGVGTTTSIGVFFDNAGTVNVNAGRLELNAGGSDVGGSYVSNADGILDFGGGTHVLDATTTVSGAGEVLFSTSVPTTTTVNGTYNVTGTTSISGGQVNFEATATTNLLNVSGGTRAGIGTLTSSGLFTWTGGILGGASTTVADGGIELSGGNAKSLGSGANTGAILINNGVANFSGGNLQIADSAGANPGSVLINNGTFNANDNADITRIGAPVPTARITNAATGIFNKNGAATTTSITVFFDNAGTVNVNGGRLELNAGGSNVGSSYLSNADGILDFGGGTHLLDAATTVSGAGEVLFSAGTTTVSGTYGVSGTTSVSGSGLVNFETTATTNLLNVIGGTRAGAATLTASGLFTWTNGTLGGNGTTVADGGIELSGGNPKSLGTGANAGAILINNGVANFSGGSLQIGESGGAAPGSNLINNGTFNAIDEADIMRSSFGGTTSRVTNAVTGFFNKSGTGTTTVISVAFDNAGIVNANEGTLRFNNGYTQTAGATVLNGGSIATNATLSIVSGSLSGTGTITGNVSNGGTIAPGFSAGTIEVTGDLSLESTSHYDLEIGGSNQGTDYDVLSEAGNVQLTLAGTITPTLLNGYTPAAGDLFMVLTSNQPLLGSFINAANNDRLLSADGLTSFRINYGTSSPFDPNSVVLSDFAAVPEPTSLLLAAVGAGFLGFRRKSTRGDVKRPCC